MPYGMYVYFFSSSSPLFSPILSSHFPVVCLSSDLKTSDLRHQTSDIRPQTSDIRPQTSDLRHQTSDIRPQTFSLLDISTSDICTAVLPSAPEVKYLYKPPPTPAITTIIITAITTEDILSLSHSVEPAT